MDNCNDSEVDECDDSDQKDTCIINNVLAPADLTISQLTLDESACVGDIGDVTLDLKPSVLEISDRMCAPQQESGLISCLFISIT